MLRAARGRRQGTSAEMESVKKLREGAAGPAADEMKFAVISNAIINIIQFYERRVRDNNRSLFWRVFKLHWRLGCLYSGSDLFIIYSAGLLV
jgi:hypothetical protein